MLVKTRIKVKLLGVIFCGHKSKECFRFCCGQTEGCIGIAEGGVINAEGVPEKLLLFRRGRLFFMAFSAVIKNPYYLFYDAAHFPIFLPFGHGDPYTWCGYETTGLNFFPLPCKLGKSEGYVLLACALPSTHG
jgi:hypothetical protein